jgi:DNA-binding winged helix-turn-helix (wHTH) protein
MRSPELAFGPFVFDPNSRLLKRDGIDLPLPPRVLAVLEVLLRRAGDVVPRQELIDSVWKDAFVTDTSLAEAVSLLRQTLGDDPQTPAYIQTLHRRGYRFVAPVAETGASAISTAAVGELAPLPMTERVEPSIGRQLVPWSIAIASAILAAVAVREAVLDRQAVDSPVTRFEIAPAPGTQFDSRAPALALAPDATRVAWAGCDGAGCRLYVRELGRLEATAIAGTEGAASPFFSPDGRALGFFAAGRLKKVAIAGGTPVTLADAADPLGAVWTPDDEIIFAGAAPGLTSVPASGGEAAALTVPRAADGEVRHAWPAYHAGANLLLFTVGGTPEVDGGGRVDALRLDSRRAPRTTLAGAADRVEVVADDLLVFSRGSDLQAASFDSRRGEISSAPQTILSNVAVSSGAGQFAAARGGALIALTAAAAGDRRPLFWWTAAAAIDGGTIPSGTAARGRDLDGLALSPDGRRAAGIDRSDAARPDIWIVDLERGTASRMTHGGINGAPVWHPSGARAFFAARDDGAFAIHARDADSQAPAARLYGNTEHAFPSAVSPDGSQLAFIARAPATGFDVWTLPLAGGAAEPLIRTPFDDVAAAFSPDGRLVAYQSNDGGRWEIYIHHLPDRRRLTVSTDGGAAPFWSTDGRWLFFRAGARLMRSAIGANGSTAGTPELVAAFPDAIPIGIDAGGRILLRRHPHLPGATAVITLQSARELRQLIGPRPEAMPR